MPLNKYDLRINLPDEQDVPFHDAIDRYLLHFQAYAANVKCKGYVVETAKPLHLNNRQMAFVRNAKPFLYY
jgi:hypothetical protein